jgi:hypothetical protein
MVFFGFVNTLSNGFRDLVGLAQTKADAAFTVSDNHDRAETEPPATFHDLRHPADMDDFIY